MRRPALVLLTLLAFVPAQLVHAQATPPAAAPAHAHSHAAALEIGRAVAKHAYAGNVDSLLAIADPATASGDDLRQRLTDGVAQLAMQLGEEVKMTAERVVRVNGRTEYWRTSEYQMVPVPLVFRVILGAEGKWRGFTATTEEQLPTAEDVQP